MKIEVKNLTKKFKNNIILENINLTLESGHIYGFMGRNGSGKSVLLKLIAGFYLPTNGTILYDNIDLNHEKKFPKATRVFIDRPNFFPDLTGYENLKLLADIQKIITDNQILKAMKIVNLLEEKDKKYSKYSLGTKQKLGLAQAIMEPSKLLILDEPFNGIEEKTVKQIIAYLKQLKKQDIIIIISSHIKEDLLALSDYIYKFDDKKVELLTHI